jgi:hypothetical protein
LLAKIEEATPPGVALPSTAEYALLVNAFAFS